METKKLLALGIIVLFIGVAVAPSINSTGSQTIIISDNHPPNNPIIIGPSRGKVGVAHIFTIVTTDPENQNVSYYIEWGDGTHTGWTDYFTSGQSVHYMHTWYKINEYCVRCKAKDTLGAESNWTYLDMPISLNLEIVQSTNNSFIEVTSQACGIQGFGNATVKLTKQQYQNLEQYLVDFRARLNQTTTKEEAIPIFKDAVVELNKYGLLPKGMSVEQAQNLVTNENHVQNISKLSEATIRNLLKPSNDEIENVFCLITGKTNDTHVLTPISRISNVFTAIFTFLMFTLIAMFIGGYNPYVSLPLVLLIIFLLVVTWPFTTVTAALTYLRDLLMRLPLPSLGLCIAFGDYLYSAQGWMSSFGILGKQNISGSIFGQRAIPIIYDLDWYQYYTYRGVFGFQGFMLCSGTDTAEYLGCALYVHVGHFRPSALLR